MSYTPKNPNGQATKDNSAPVVIASNQDALPITDNSGSITVDQATGTNLHIVVDSGTITTLTPGTGSTNLGKSEDAAHTTGDVGVMALGVRQDADTSPVSADGDYHAPIFNSIGRMKVSALPGATTATTGNITTSTGAVSTDVSHHGGAIFTTTGTFSGFNGTFEASIDNGTTYFGVQVARTTTGIIESTTGVISAAPSYAWRVNCSGYTNIRIRATALTSGTVVVTIAPAAFATDNAPSVALQSGTNTIGSIASIATSVVPGTAATNLGKAEDAVHASGDTGVMSLAVRQDSEASLVSTSGDYSPLAVDATGKLRTSVSGSVAHDAVDAGAPVKIGGKASSSAPTDVSASDRVDAYFDLKGRLKVDGSDVVQPVSASSLPLPSGAATSAKQDTGFLGTANFAVGQVSVTTSATSIAASRATRRSITIVNLGTTDIYIGGSGVTTSTGQLLIGIKGSAITMEVVGAIYGIVGTGTQSVSFEEEYS